MSGQGMNPKAVRKLLDATADRVLEVLKGFELLWFERPKVGQAVIRCRNCTRGVEVDCEPRSELDHVVEAAFRHRAKGCERTRYVVFRTALGRPCRLGDREGYWYERETVLAATPMPPSPAFAHSRGYPTGRHETREDGEIAEIYEFS